MLSTLRKDYHKAHTWAHKHTVVAVLLILSFGFMAFSELLLPTLSTQAAYSPTWCADNEMDLDIPLAECEALAALYIDSNGDNWTDTTNWFETTTICSTWFGITCQDDLVIQIILPSNNLQGDINLTNLTNLNYVNLAENALTSVDARSLTNLMWLDVGYNQITTIQLSGSTALEYLAVWVNQIASLDTSSLTNIEQLHASSNQLTSINVVGFTTLTILTLHENQINYIDLTDVTNLEDLSLDNNLLTDFTASDYTLYTVLSYASFGNNCLNPSTQNTLNFLNTYGGSWAGSQNMCDIPERDNDPQTRCTFYADDLTIPGPECEALADLYVSTNGASRSQLLNPRFNTNSSLDICSWYGIGCAAGHITQITLNDNNLQGSIPSSIQDLDFVDILNFESNSITSIPEEIAGMDSLQQLLLSHNQILSIPSTIGSMTNLTHLELSNNDLTTLPTELWDAPNLSVVLLDRNKLTHIPAEVVNLTTLTSLNMSFNVMTGPIPDLSGLTLLNNAFLSFNFLDLTGSDPAALAFLDTLPANPPSIPNAAYFYNIQGDYDTLTQTLQSQWCLDNAMALDISVIECIALADLYTNTDGDNWYNSTNWFQTTNVCDEDNGWYGIFGGFANFMSQSADTYCENGSIGSMLLANNNIVGSIPSSLELLGSLGMLSFHNNEITTIPDEIGNMLALGILALGGNHLNSIPDTLSDMNLIILSLGRRPSSLFFKLFFTALLESTFIEDIEQQFNILVYFHPSLLFTVRNLDPGLDSYNQILSNMFRQLFGDNQATSHDNQLTALPSSFANLDNLRFLDLSYNVFSSFPAELTNLSEIVSIDISSNDISTIDSAVTNMSQLFSLSLNDNNISTIPSDIEDMSSLIELYVSSNQISALPTEIANTNIVSLGLSNNLFATFPVEIFSMPDLENLSLGDNQLTTLPNNIGDLTNLAILDLGGNDITPLPESIGDLTTLYNLYLDNNQLSDLPSSFTDLSHLTYLDVGYNYLCSLVSPMTDFIDIEDVDRLSTQICGPVLGCTDPLASNYNALANQDDGSCIAYGCTDPAANNYDELAVDDDGSCTYTPILGCTDPAANNYDELANQDDGSCTYDRDNNPETRCSTFSGSIDISLPECEALVDLYVDTNGANWNNTQNMEYPWFENTTICNNNREGWYGVNCTDGHVTTLNVASNNLNGLIPDSIEDLSYLESLYLGGNGLSSLPLSIGNITNLQNLYLGDNQFTELPLGIQSLSNLLVLDMGGKNGNQLTTLPIWIDSLTNLQELYISNNNITDLPEELGNLSTLLRLDVCRNELTEIPSSIFDLSNLEYLVLCDNAISTVPSDIGTLINLQELNIERNFIITLPASLGDLSNLGVLVVNHNLLSSLPDEIGDLNNLYELRINNNQLTTLPSSLANLSNLGSFMLYHNLLSGPIPSYFADFANSPYMELQNNCFDIGTTDQDVQDLFDNSIYGYEIQNLCNVTFSKTTETTGAYRDDIVSYTLTVTNNGAYPISNISVLDFGSLLTNDNDETIVTNALSFEDSTPGYDDYINTSYQNVIGGDSDICYQDFLQEQGVYRDTLAGVVQNRRGYLDFSTFASSNGFVGDYGDIAEWFVDEYCINNYESDNIHECFYNIGLYAQDIITANPTCGRSIVDIAEHYQWNLGIIGAGQSASIEVLMQVVGGDAYDVGYTIDNMGCAFSNYSSSTCDPNLISNVGIEYLGINSAYYITQDGATFTESPQTIRVPNMPGADVVIIHIGDVDYTASYDSETDTWYADVELVSGENQINVSYYNIDEELIDDTYTINVNLTVYDGNLENRCSFFATDISIPECEALVDLYLATDGANWNNTLSPDHPWFESTTICNNDGLGWYNVNCTDGHVTYLSLSSNNLNGPIPDSIGDLIYLEHLDLGANGLSVLPTSIDNMSNLQYLYLYNNQFTELPAGIQQLSNLIMLDMAGKGGNQLTTLPNWIDSLTSLQELYIENNNITDLPSEIGNLSTLTHLYVCNNELTEIPSGIFEISNLQYLRLCDNNITSVSSDIENLSSLVLLNLAGNELSVLPNSLGNLPNLSQLDLSYNILTTLPTEIGDLSNLSELYINHNQLTQLPGSLANLINLIAFTLNDNLLTGPIPSYFSELPNNTYTTLENNCFDIGTTDQDVQDLFGNSIYGYENQNLCNLSLSKTANVSGARDGDIVTYSIGITNNGDYAVSNLSMMDFGSMITEFPGGPWIPTPNLGFTSSNIAYDSYTDTTYSHTMGGDEDICYQDFLQEEGIYRNTIESDMIIGQWGYGDFASFALSNGFVGNFDEMAEWFVDTYCPDYYGASTLQGCLDNIGIINTDSLLSSYPECGVTAIDLAGHYLWNIDMLNPGQTTTIDVSMAFIGDKLAIGDSIYNVACIQANDSSYCDGNLLSSVPTIYLGPALTQSGDVFDQTGVSIIGTGNSGNYVVINIIGGGIFGGIVDENGIYEIPVILKPGSNLLIITIYEEPESMVIVDESTITLLVDLPPDEDPDDEDSGEETPGPSSKPNRSPSIKKDECIPIPPGDISPSYYDKDCGDEAVRENLYKEYMEGLQHDAADTDINIDHLFPALPEITKYQALLGEGISTDLESIKAYLFAKAAGLTTMPSYTDARPDDTITRAEFSKVLAGMLENVLKRKPDASRLAACSVYDDTDKVALGDLYYTIIKVCMYSVMGLENDGITPLKSFNPHEILSRKDVVTTLSRVLYGNRYDKAEPYYVTHMNVMNKNGLIVTTDPDLIERRINIFIIVMRIAEKVNQLLQQ